MMHDRAKGFVRRVVGRALRGLGLKGLTVLQVEHRLSTERKFAVLLLSGGVSSETLAEVVARRAARLPGNALHDVFYQYGFHLLRKHYYLPIPDDTDDLDAFWKSSSKLAGVDMNETAALDLMRNVLPEYLREFRSRFPLLPEPGGSGFHLMNGGYMAVDAHVYYGLIRSRKPQRIIEIGCGSSTYLAAAALERNQEEGAAPARFTSIDPYPPDNLRNGYRGLSELVPRPVQSVPAQLFETLEANDILFIDSSHVIRSGNDVHYEYLEILPRLKPGVLVHVHDISLPKPYPRVYHDNQLYWNEQYLLQAFLIHNSRFEVLWPGNYMMERHPDEMLATFPEFAQMRKEYPMSEPTAFWMRVRS